MGNALCGTNRKKRQDDINKLLVAYEDSANTDLENPTNTPNYHTANTGNNEELKFEFDIEIEDRNGCKKIYDVTITVVGGIMQIVIGGTAAYVYVGPSLKWVDGLPDLPEMLKTLLKGNNLFTSIYGNFSLGIWGAKEVVDLIGELLQHIKSHPLDIPYWLKQSFYFISSLATSVPLLALSMKNSEGNRTVASVGIDIGVFIANTIVFWPAVANMCNVIIHNASNRFFCRDNFKSTLYRQVIDSILEDMANSVDGKNPIIDDGKFSITRSQIDSQLKKMNTAPSVWSLMSTIAQYGIIMGCIGAGNANIYGYLRVGLEELASLGKEANITFNAFSTFANICLNVFFALSSATAIHALLFGEPKKSFIKHLAPYSCNAIDSISLISAISSCASNLYLVDQYHQLFTKVSIGLYIYNFFGGIVANGPPIFECGREGLILFKKYFGDDIEKKAIGEYETIMALRKILNNLSDTDFLQYFDLESKSKVSLSINTHKAKMAKAPSNVAPSDTMYGTSKRGSINTSEEPENTEEKRSCCAFF